MVLAENIGFTTFAELHDVFSSEQRPGQAWQRSGHLQTPGGGWPCLQWPDGIFQGMQHNSLAACPKCLNDMASTGCILIGSVRFEGL